MIDILLATYNGAAWLEAQIDSLLAQDCQDWRLLVRDDGSTDATLAVLQAQQARLGERMRIVADDRKNLGPAGNFGCLLETSTADYVMFCDQDDVWLPGKISQTLARMRETETACGTATPVLVHTDLQIVDERLQLVAASGHRHQGIDPIRGDTLGRLLLQNIATGCTVMLNRALRERALPIPAGALMHDHWLILVAACFGKIAYLPVPTMLYRQHGANQVGAQSWNPAYVARLLFQLPAIRRVLARNRQQASALRERYGDVLPAGTQALLEAFIHMPGHGPLQKRRDIFRYGFFYTGAVRNMGWLLLC